MPPIAATLCFFSALLLELCWLGAWVTFIWAGFSEHTFPLPDMLVAAALAALIPRATAHLRLRNVYALALQSACLLGFFLVVRQRLPDHGPLHSVLLGVSTTLFWISGALHARRTLTHRTLCARFDFGMYWLLALLGIRLLLRGQAQVPQQAALTDALVPSFFVHALCAICLSRYGSQGSKQWLRVSGRIAMLFGGLAGLGTLGFSITWMCRPYLRALAQTTHSGAGVVIRPIANAAAGLIVALMREGKKHPLPQFLPRMPSPHQGHRAWDNVPVEVSPVDTEALTMVWIAGVVLLLVCLALWLWWARHWLWTRQHDGAPGVGLWALCLQLWWRVLGFVRSRGSGTAPEPIRALNALLIWGARSGVARHGAETSLEYARRLKRSFPADANEIDCIVDNHCRQTYALGCCNAHELQQARRALRKLRSPRRWWARTASRWRAVHARQSEPA